MEGILWGSPYPYTGHLLVIPLHIGIAIRLGGIKSLRVLTWRTAAIALFTQIPILGTFLVPTLNHLTNAQSKDLKESVVK